MTGRTSCGVRAGAVFLVAVLAACGNDSQATAPRTDAVVLRESRVPDPSADVNKQLAALRQVTVHFQDIQAAKDAGYAQITPCWTSPSSGAMGYHFAKGIDTHVDLLEPEALMYEPLPGGKMKLVGMEYIVPDEEWFATHSSPPELLGQTFTPFPLLSVHKLHIWLYRENPTGMFMDWNPKVTCANAEETQVIE